MSTTKISIYVDSNGGTVYEYEIPAEPDRAREHAAQIIEGGYRHNDRRDGMVFIPPHRIFKVVVSGMDCPTGYPGGMRYT